MMDNLFWADEASRLFREGYTAKEAIEIVEVEKETYERSIHNGNDNTIHQKAINSRSKSL